MEKKYGKLSLVGIVMFFWTVGLFAQAPDTLWTRTYGGTEDDNGYSVQQTSDSGYIIAGYTESFDVGYGDVYLIKTNADGDTLWTKTYGGTSSDQSRSVQRTSDGGYIIVGYTRSFGAGQEDIYLIKTDSSGDTLWTKTYGGTDADKGSSVQQTSDGGYIIAGYTKSFGAGSWDVYLIKTDVDGDTLWTRTYGGTDIDYGYSVQQTYDGGYIVVGFTYVGTINADAYLIKTNSSGDTLWTKTYGGSWTEHGYSVQQTSDSGYIITGQTSSFGAGSDDVYLIKTDSVGDTLWTRTYGGTKMDMGWSVQRTSDGGYIIAGGTRSFGAGDCDVYLVKTDANGDTLWTRTYGKEDYDCGHSVQQTFDKEYIVVGVIDMFSTEGGDVYLIKTEPDPASIEPDIALSDTMHNFGNVTPGDSLDWKLRIFNLGGDTLIVDSCQLTVVSKFSVVSPSFPQNIVPNDSVDVTVRFTPDVEGIYQDTLSVFSNDPNESIVYVYLTGTGITWPMFHHDNYHTGLSPLTGDMDTCELLWSYTTGSSISSSPALGDINGDGKLEVVIGSNNSKVYALNGEDGSLLWSYTTGDEIHSSPALGDIDGDGKLEVVVGSNDRKVYALNGEDGSLLWSYKTNGGVSSSAALGDIDEDGNIEVVIGSSDGLYTLNGEDGSLLWSYEASGYVYSVPAIGDIDRDGNLEVIFGSWDYKVYALNGEDGSFLWSYETGDHILSSPAIGDIDEDGKLEVVIGASIFDKKVYALNGEDGSFLWSYETNGSVHSPALGDIDGDRKLEVVVHSSDDKVYALNGGDGSLLWVCDSGKTVQSSPAIGDIDGDGNLEVVIGSYTLNGGDGSLLWVSCETAQVLCSPALGDIDGDRNIEVVIGAGGKVYALNGKKTAPCDIRVSPDSLIFTYNSSKAGKGFGYEIIASEAAKRYMTEKQLLTQVERSEIPRIRVERIPSAISSLLTPAVQQMGKGKGVDTLHPSWESPFGWWSFDYRIMYEATQLTPSQPGQITAIMHGVGSPYDDVSKECSVFVWENASDEPGAKLAGNKVTATADSAGLIYHNWYSLASPISVSGAFWVGNVEWDTLFPTSIVDDDMTSLNMYSDDGSTWLDDVADYFHAAVVSYGAPEADTVGVMTVFNEGGDTLSVSDIVGTESWIADISPTSFSVAPGDSQEVTVTVTRSGLTDSTYYANLEISSNDPDEPTYDEPVKFIVKLVGVEESPVNYKHGLTIAPNPVGQNTAIIRYALSEESRVTLSIYDLSGRLVETLVDSKKKPGEHTVKWDMKEHAVGVYFVRFTEGTYITTKKLTILR